MRNNKIDKKVFTNFLSIAINPTLLPVEKQLFISSLLLIIAQTYQYGD